MSDSDVLENTPKLKIFALVADSYRAVFGNLGVMVRILWLPMALMGVVNFRFQDQHFEDLNAVLKAQNDSAAVQAQLDVASDPMFIIYWLVSWVVMVAAFVSLHRFVLLGDNPPSLGFTVHKREWRYLGYLAAIVVTITLAMIVPIIGLTIFEMTIEAVFGTTGGMVGILIFAAFVTLLVCSVTLYIRLGFVLPAIALDHGGGLGRRFKHAWALAKGNTFRMFVALIVASLPFLLIFGIWSYQFMQSVAEAMATGTAFPAPNMVVVIVVFGGMSWLSYALIITTYSLAYRTLELASVEQQVEA